MTAFALVLSAPSQNPTNPAHHHNLAPLLVAQGNVGAAIHHYRRAFQLNPEDVDSKSDLAVILLRMGKWEASLAALCQVVAKDSNHYQGHLNLSAVYFSKGQYGLALKHATRGTQLRPSDPVGHRTLGHVLDQMGNSGMSLHHRKIAVRRGPGAANATQGGGVNHPLDIQTYKKVGVQLVMRGAAERDNGHAFMDAYRAMCGKRVDLANSERTQEILQKCMR